MTPSAHPELRGDYHVHSEFSWDTGPRASLLRACAHAVDIGLPAVAFTEHLDFTVWDAADRATAQGLKDRHPANQLPIPLRAQIISLSLWVSRHTSSVIRREEEIEPLIDINRIMMNGLSGGAEAA